MKPFLFLFVFLISIECIQSKKQLLRTYIVKRDNLIRMNVLSAYTVYDSTGIKPLYRLKPTSADIDTIVVHRQPDNDMIANMEGEWVEKNFNPTISLYDQNSTKWIDGVIRKDAGGLRDKYSVSWNGKYLNTKTKFWSGIMQVFNTPSKELVAQIKRRTAWFTGDVKFELKIYSNQFSDILYFFLIAIDDHRYQISTSSR